VERGISGIVAAEPIELLMSALGGKQHKGIPPPNVLDDGKAPSSLPHPGCAARGDAVDLDELSIELLQVAIRWNKTQCPPAIAVAHVIDSDPP
jgi:hypothetical protein